MSRLAAPWQLIRLGVKAAGSDTAARIAETPYGVTVTIVLAELERLVGELREDLRSGQGVAVGALLKTIHDAARGLRTELDLPIDSHLGPRARRPARADRRTAARGDRSRCPAACGACLRPRPPREIRPNSALDPDEVAETEALVEFVGACRYFAERTRHQRDDAAHLFRTAALSRHRHPRAARRAAQCRATAERSFRQSQVDAAVRLCAKVFGKDYAALLAKAAEVARGRRAQGSRAPEKPPICPPNAALDLAHCRHDWA